MNLSFFSDIQKSKQRVCLVQLGYMQKVKKSMDFFVKKTLAKFACKSKKFAKLLEDNNICIVLENDRNIKNCLLEQK